MLDLSQLPLLRNAQKLIEEINQWHNDSLMLEGRDALTLALNKADFTSLVFTDENLLKYALLAYQFEQICEAQLTSVLLYWAATADYPETSKTSLKVHQLSEYDYKTRQILEQYLQLQRSSYDPSSANEELSDDIKARIFKQLLSTEIPISERCFMTFDIPAYTPNATIFHAIAKTGFCLFMPIQNNGKITAIIPSFSIIQSTLDYLAPYPKKLVARIGEDTFDEVFEMHKRDEHPFGLSVPGFEKTQADDNLSGRFGFALHDIYHVTLLSFTPHKELFIELVTLAKELHEDSPQSSKVYFQEAVESIIDNEFRGYTFENSMKQSLSAAQQQLYTSKEMALLFVFLSILTKTVYYNKRLEELEQSISVDQSIREALLKLNPQLALPSKLKFCQHFLFELFARGGKLGQEELNLATLTSLILYEKGTFFNPQDLNSCYGLQRSYFKAQLTALSLIEKYLMELLTHPEHQPNHQWFNQYKTLRAQLLNAATTNNKDLLTSLFSDKAHANYIVNLDKIAGQTPSLAEIAVNLGHLEVLILLKAQGAQLNNAMLFEAQKNKDLAMLNYLLEQGVNAYTQDKKGFSVVDYCLQQGDKSALKLLLNYVSLGQNHLFYLEVKGIKIHPDCLNLLQAYNAFKDKLYDIKTTYKSESRLSKLKALVAENTEHFSYATFLENQKVASISKPNAEYRTDTDAIMFSPLFCNLDSEEEFAILEQGQPINLNLKNKNGATPLLRLLENGSFSDNDKKKCEFLIDLGADVNTLNNKKQSALLLAFRSLQLELIDKLISKGAKFNMESEQSLYMESLFNLIALNNNRWDDIARLITLLVQNGYDLNRKSISPINAKNKMVSTWSLMRDFPMLSYDTQGNRLFTALKLPQQLRTLCIELGANPNELSYEGKLELNTAISDGWEEYFTLLLKKKASPNAVDEKGNSPLHVAYKYGDEEAIKVLLEQGAKSFANKKGDKPEDLVNTKNPSLLASSSGFFSNISTENDLDCALAQHSI